MMRKQPKAKVLSDQHGVTVWQVDWPSSPHVWGKTYFATTHAGSDEITLKTAVTKVRVAEKQAAKIMPQVRAAISRAKG